MKKRQFEDITMVIDTREELPLVFTRCPSVVEGMPTGDYTVKGLEPYICIERKSISDLVTSCCSKEREVFEAKLQRMKAYKWSFLVIEGTAEEIYAGKYRSRGAPEAVIGSILSFAVRYGVPPLLCGNPEQMARMVEHLSLMCVRNLDTFADALGYVPKEKEDE